MATDLAQQVMSILNLTLRTILVSCGWILTLVLVLQFHTDKLNFVLIWVHKYNTARNKTFRTESLQTQSEDSFYSDFTLAGDSVY